jgi:ribose/xylose/arabinose/galactoside ABC-type transport system permease subunit
VLGTLIGAVLLGILNNGLNLMGINPYLQDIIRGVIILLAIYIARNGAEHFHPAFDPAFHPSHST